MTYKDLPEDVRRFVLTSVPSVPYLEAILLLRGDRQGRWTAQSVARRLYLREAAAAELLEGLAAAGIAQDATEPPAETPSYRYAPPPELAAMLDAVAAAYSTHLVTVTDLIHSRVEKRAQQFADAFRWRKDS